MECIITCDRLVEWTLFAQIQTSHFECHYFCITWSMVTLDARTVDIRRSQLAHELEIKEVENRKKSTGIIRSKRRNQKEVNPSCPLRVERWRLFFHVEMHKFAPFHHLWSQPCTHCNRRSSSIQYKNVDDDDVYRCNNCRWSVCHLSVDRSTPFRFLSVAHCLLPFGISCYFEPDLLAADFRLQEKQLMTEVMPSKCVPLSAVIRQTNAALSKGFAVNASPSTKWSRSIWPRRNIMRLMDIRRFGANTICSGESRFLSVLVYARRLPQIQCLCDACAHVCVTITGWSTACNREIPKTGGNVYQQQKQHIFTLRNPNT